MNFVKSKSFVGCVVGGVGFIYGMLTTYHIVVPEWVMPIILFLGAAVLVATGHGDALMTLPPGMSLAALITRFFPGVDAQAVIAAIEPLLPSAPTPKDKPETDTTGTPGGQPSETTATGAATSVTLVLALGLSLVLSACAGLTGSGGQSVALTVSAAEQQLPGVVTSLDTILQASPLDANSKALVHTAAQAVGAVGTPGASISTDLSTLLQIAQTAPLSASDKAQVSNYVAWANVIAQCLGVVINAAQQVTGLDLRGGKIGPFGSRSWFLTQNSGRIEGGARGLQALRCISPRWSLAA